jgi:hypothetical protein
MHRPPLPPRKYSWYSFLLKAESTPGPECYRSTDDKVKVKNLKRNGLGFEAQTVVILNRFRIYIPTLQTKFSLLSWSLVYMMELASSLETSVGLYQTSRRHVEMTAIFMNALVINRVLKTCFMCESFLPSSRQQHKCPWCSNSRTRKSSVSFLMAGPLPASHCTVQVITRKYDITYTDFSSLKKEAENPSEELVSICQTTWRDTADAHKLAT